MYQWNSHISVGISWIIYNRYLQFDSWWYLKGKNQGTKTWEPRTDVFPGGFRYLNFLEWNILAKRVVVLFSFLSNYVFLINMFSVFIFFGLLCFFLILFLTVTFRIWFSLNFNSPFFFYATFHVKPFFPSVFFVCLFFFWNTPKCIVNLLIISFFYVDLSHF